MFKIFKKKKDTCQDACCKPKVEKSCNCPDCAEKNNEINVESKDDCCDEDSGEDSDSDGCCENEPDIVSNRIRNNRESTYIYNVAGMDCGSCALTIQKGIASIKEIDDTKVNFSTGKMTVVTNSIHIAKKDVLKKVKQLGYSARLVDDDNVGEKKTISQGQVVLISTLLFALGLTFEFLIINSLISNIFYALTMGLAGFKTFRSAWFGIKAKSLDMNVLMSIASIGAVLIGQWSEGATVLYLFVIGIYLQNKAVNRTRQSIKEMMSLAPDNAILYKNGEWIEVESKSINVGDTILVRSGDKIALDGIIEKGNTNINQSSITGESIPVSKKIGDSVYAGSINESGTIEVRTTKVASDSTISQIVKMVEEAEERKAPSEAFIDKFSRIYTPIVFVVAILTMILPPFWGMDLKDSIFKGLELLIVACPCALVISTPVSIVSAIGNAAKNGVLVKGGSYLETASKISAIAFDKTGTITKGKPEVIEVEIFEGTEQELLSISRSLEQNATHPIAKSIVKYALAKEAQILKVTDEQNIVGKGMTAKILGKNYSIGSSKLFNLTIQQESFKKMSESNGNTVIFVGREKIIIGAFLVQDTLRKSSIEAISKLKSVGIKKLVMLTGDNQKVASNIAKQAGLSDTSAELMPQDKAKQIEVLQQNSTVAMVGDGINDAPALATSDLGIAMGGAGTDTAMETSDIVLMADNLNKLPYLLLLSKSTVRIIKENITLSLMIKLLALIAVFGGFLPIWLAVLSDTGMAIIVTLNAIRLLAKKDNIKI
ncbi:heavy metal translocating P-type ATPase [Lactococcus lactis]|uniref:heavy metal translocating P-type ATPase n=1 Tax=Lactococcus lactis TaxID=1358 RepID=UPI001896B299|nr:cation-translocating P-type ATPase [Lactococcus lactis]